mmetsp:Transcript_40156/g.59552  ORF Transcript_40156/g.59552 Transcript_40156/m.59552 type:complete len:164 (-) Transcript_40156:541-1032(-)
MIALPPDAINCGEGRGNEPVDKATKMAQRKSVHSLLQNQTIQYGELALRSISTHRPVPTSIKKVELLGAFNFIVALPSMLKSQVLVQPPTSTTSEASTFPKYVQTVQDAPVLDSVQVGCHVETGIAVSFVRRNHIAQARLLVAFAGLIHRRSIVPQKLMSVGF